MVLIFNEILDLFGFLTATAYTIVPGIFLYQLNLNILNEERLSIIGILCLYFNGLIYFIRSLVFYKEEIDIRDFCNLAGAYLGFIYIVIYLKHFYYKTNKKKFVLLIVIITLSSLAVVLLEIIMKKNDIVMKVVEWVGAIFNICEYLPIGFSLFHLIKNKISEKYTLFGAFLGLLNTTIWIIWAISKIEENKLHSFIANIFGLLLCLIQISIFFIFRKGESKENKNVIDANDDISTNIIPNLETPTGDDDYINKEKTTSEIINDFI